MPAPAVYFLASSHLQNCTMEGTKDGYPMVNRSPAILGGSVDRRFKSLLANTYPFNRQAHREGSMDNLTLSSISQRKYPEKETETCCCFNYGIKHMLESMYTNILGHLKINRITGGDELT